MTYSSQTRRGSFEDATVQDRPEHRVLPGGHRAAFFLQPVCTGRYSTRDQKRTFGDAIVQGCSRPPARSGRCLVTDGTPASAPGRALGYSTSTWERPPLIHRGRKLSSGEPASEESRFSSSIFFSSLEQRPDPSSFRQASGYAAPTKQPPSSARRQSPWSRVPLFPLAPACCYPQPASWADLVRADPLKAHDGHSLARRIGGPSRIEGAVPARRFKEQDTTPEPGSVEQDFVGEES